MTPFSEVFKIYLSIVKEDLYTLYDEEVLTEELSSLLIRAITNFEYSKVSLEYEVEYDSDNDNIKNYTFINTLTNAEIVLLAEMMASYWLEDHLFDSRLATAVYIDKDFSIKQQEQIKALATICKDNNERLNYNKKMYGRKTANGTPNFSGLAGGVL